MVSCYFQLQGLISFVHSPPPQSTSPSTLKFGERVFYLRRVWFHSPSSVTFRGSSPLKTRLRAKLAKKPLIAKLAKPTTRQKKVPPGSWHPGYQKVATCSPPARASHSEACKASHLPKKSSSWKWTLRFRRQHRGWHSHRKFLLKADPRQQE